MKHPNTMLAVLAIACMAQSGSAMANLIGSPRLLDAAVHQINFERPTLAPFAFTQFCLRYAQECKPRKVIFRGGRLALTSSRLKDLHSVNRAVNSTIIAERNFEGLAGEKWVINPPRGDCNDYAVTKRHALMKLGWPARALLLSEVITSWGEHHLVLVVRTRGGDLVLDNLSHSVVSWTRKPYKWVRIQTPENPRFWAAIGERNLRIS